MKRPVLTMLLVWATLAPKIYAQGPYPGREWPRKSPTQLGFDETALKRLVPKYGIGGVIIRHGYVAASWGNMNTAVQTASLGKAFTGATLGLAIDARMVKLDDPVWKTWTGAGELSHSYKDLDYGLQAHITWRHMVTMTAGFPGFDVFTPGADMGDARWNYARREPGVRFEYSDGGMWRFSQALTKLWRKDLKSVLDEKIFGMIGVPNETWDWMSGKEVHDNELYPGIPGYGSYLDPPWEVDGNIVRGGPGWVVINADALARFGYLMLRNGRWNGKQLLGESWIKEMQRPQTKMNSTYDYGFNWWIYGGGKGYAARGISIGWAATSSLWVIPASDLVIAFIRSNLHTATQKEAYEKNDWDERDFAFQVAATLTDPSR